MLSLGYGRSPFHDFEIYRRVVVGLDEDDIQLFLKQFNSNFIRYEIPTGVHSIKDTSGAVYTMGENGKTPQDKYEDFSMKTKPVLTRIGGNFGTLRFDEKSFVIILLGFTSYWAYKPTNATPADSPRVYTSEKIIN